MNYIDNFLNRITMYRLLMLSLAWLAAIAIALSLFNIVSFGALNLIVSLAILLVSAQVANRLCAYAFRAAPTPESAYITALILFFILAPVTTLSDAAVLVAAAVLAMLSKYVLAFNRKHIFNPAAASALILSLLGVGSAIWWVATPVLLPFVLVIGLLVVRKIRRFDLVWVFLATALVTYGIRSAIAGPLTLDTFTQFFLSWPLIFFGTIMLTEPQTMPGLPTDRRIFGVIVGFLFSVTFVFGTLAATPEFALIIGNLYAFAVNQRRRFSLTLASINPLTRNTFEYVFTPDVPVKFLPGQYMEWTMAHKKSDQRGVRRYFTIASAPEDAGVRIGIKLPEESSSFKAALRGMAAGDQLHATGVSGSFTLPKDPTAPIAAAAGGIGITPFMSMFRYLHAKGERRDIALIYSVATPLDFAYQDELESYKDSIGLKIVYLPTTISEASWPGIFGYLTNTLIEKEMPDYKTRQWYLSGPDPMVRAYKKLVLSLGVPRTHIKTDYFPGL